MGTRWTLWLVAAVACFAPGSGQALPSAASPRIEKSKVDGNGFLAEMRAGASYAAGKEGTVEVVLDAKGDFKINQQFPTKVKMADPPDGLTYPKRVLKKEDGSFGEKKATFKVPFVAQRAGKFTVSATLSLSVCDDKKCLMEKVPLDVVVNVQ